MQWSLLYFTSSAAFRGEGLIPNHICRYVLGAALDTSVLSGPSLLPPVVISDSDAQECSHFRHMCGPQTNSPLIVTD